VIIDIILSTLGIQPFGMWRSFPYSLVNRYRRFAGTHCLRLQGKISTLKMDAADSSEMSPIILHGIISRKTVICVCAMFLDSFENDRPDLSRRTIISSDFMFRLICYKPIGCTIHITRPYTVHEIYHIGIVALFKEVFSFVIPIKQNDFLL
jgi:hypothetical protein